MYQVCLRPCEARKAEQDVFPGIDVPRMLMRLPKVCALEVLRFNNHQASTMALVLNMECTTSHDEGAKRLRELTLFNMPLSDSQLHIITTNCPSLHSLIFSSCSGVSDAQLVSFVNQVSGKLHHFSMRGSISKYSDPTDIGGCSIGRLCHLTELDISDCP